jgi:putative ABC transport system ATP-binding protein
MIRLENVEKVYRTESIETVALANVSLSIGEGEFVAIMGPSGSGKITLLNICGLLDSPSRGRILIGEDDVTAHSDRDLAKFRNRALGFIFQTFHLIGDLTVVDNVEIPLLYRRMSSTERRKRALDALARVGLSARAFHFPTQLSGGQQQRVAIARAVVGEPRILLADEPTGNLDSQMGDEIVDILKSLNADRKTTVVMVTHDQRQADKTNRIVRIFDGRQVN